MSNEQAGARNFDLANGWLKVKLLLLYVDLKGARAGKLPGAE